MPLNRYVVRVDPQGQTVTVDVRDTSGVSAAVFESSQFDARARALPLVITSQTEFWLRAPGPYDVSCLVGGAEVAAAGAPKRVEVSDVPVLVVPDWERQRTAAASGGGSAPVTRQWFNSRDSQETVASGSFHQLSWVPFPIGSGDDLLDLTDPVTPVPHAAGIYAVTVNVCLDDTLPGAGVFDLFIELDMDLNGIDGTASSVFPINCDNPIGVDPQGSVTCVCYLPADGVVAAYVQHNTGQAQSFFLEALVQRIS